MPLFQFKDKTIHYELKSSSAPNDTLFLHGNLASNRWWHPTVKLIQERYFGQGYSGGLCMAEWLGCGKSSAPKSASDLEIKSLAQDIVALVHGLGLDQVNLVGHSTGGLIALFCLLEAPDLFNRAVLLDSVAANGIHFGPEMYEAFSKMSEDRNYCEAVMVSTIHGAKAEDLTIQALVEDAFRVDKKIWHGIPEALKSVDIRSDLSRITHPVLVLHGQFDTLLPSAGGKDIASKVKNGEFREIPGHGHSTNIENPKLCAELICDFLFES